MARHMYDHSSPTSITILIQQSLRDTHNISPTHRCETQTNHNGVSSTYAPPSAPLSRERCCIMYNAPIWRRVHNNAPNMLLRLDTTTPREPAGGDTFKVPDESTITSSIGLKVWGRFHRTTLQMCCWIGKE